MEISPDKYFDKIYCINLAHRKDRLLKFRKNIRNLGTDKITYFSAIDGTKVIDHDWEHSKGALGCRLSHLTILKEAKHNNFKKILIFEDDAIVLKSFRSKFEYLISIVGDNWDMIYFGGKHYLKPDVIDRKVIKLNNTLTTHSLAINHRCYDKLIKKIEEDKRWLDSVIADLHPKLVVYGFQNMPVKQSDGYSDIVERNINYYPSLLQQLPYFVKATIKKIIKSL